MLEFVKLDAGSKSEELEADGVSEVEPNAWVIGDPVRLVIFKFEFDWLFLFEHRFDIENEEEDVVDDVEDEEDGMDEFGVGKPIATFVE